MTWRLEQALEQLDAIHVHVMRAELFRGYRPAPMLWTAALAVLAALGQSLVPSALETVRGFVLYWLVVALAAVLICAFDIWNAVRENHHEGVRNRTVPVLAQFFPAMSVGAILTLLWADRPEGAFLPGLWACVFGLGVLASRPFLPRAVGFVGLMYVVAGSVTLATGARSGEVPSPWSMGLTFGFGQAAIALVLFRGMPRIEEPARPRTADGSVSAERAPMGGADV